MLIKNLVDCWIYELETKKIDGETIKKWKYKSSKRLNVQQDIDELDVNQAGVVDYDKLKIRVDYEVDIEKGNGISLFELKIDTEGYALETPQYKVIASPKVGKTTTYTCEVYYGD